MINFPLMIFSLPWNEPSLGITPGEGTNHEETLCAGKVDEEVLT